MIKTIKKGKHRAWPPSIGLYWNKTIIRKKVTFHSSCRYPVDEERDVNKIVGIGYFPNHHKDSARWGWRYSPVNDKVELLAYTYVKGIRHIDHVCFVDFDKEHELLLLIGGFNYQFVCESYGRSQPYFHSEKLGYPLGCYFGGSSAAPHKMSIEIT